MSVGVRACLMHVYGSAHRGISSFVTGRQPPPCLPYPTEPAVDTAQGLPSPFIRHSSSAAFPD
ncbi:hypothetical protein B0H19DRAFT_195265 [Mycena capillaripes]|nr:hypothetical protein B0H19DRAFT_195265 [Mycena capillaripes]